MQTQTGARLQFSPGTLWNYSNDNYVLAGLVAERASGLPYQRLLAERVFARAGLTSTTLLPVCWVLARPAPATPGASHTPSASPTTTVTSRRTLSLPRLWIP